MSAQADSVRPPRMAVWMMSLFTPSGEADAMMGDLLEEFSTVASTSGAVAARRWFWRQAMKTSGHLAVDGFRTAPLTVTTVVIAAFLLRWFVFWWSNPFVNRATEAVLEKCCANDPQAYVFWLVNSMLATHAIVNALVGAAVACVSKKREMTAAIGLAVLGDLLAIEATVWTVVKSGDTGVLGTLPYSFAFSLAIVAGAAVVRTRGSRAHA